MPGYSYASNNVPSRRRSSQHRRSSEAAPRSTANYIEADPVKEASRAALRQAQQRHARRRGDAQTVNANNGYYYQIPRTETPEIPSYETFLAEARARDHSRAAESTHRMDPASMTSYPAQYQPYQYQYGQQFYPNPYLYGYPSGYYREIRAPLHHTDSTRTGKSGRSSTLVGSSSEDTAYSPTLVPSSARPSMERPQSGRTSYSNRASYPSRRSTRQSRQSRQTRVSWSPTTYSPQPTYKEPADTPKETGYGYVSDSSSNNTNTDTSSKLYPAPLFSTSDDDGLLPVSAIKPVDLSPLKFIDHEKYLIPDSTIQRNREERDRHNRAQFAALVQNELRGFVGVGESDFSSFNPLFCHPPEGDEVVPSLNMELQQFLLSGDIADLPSKSMWSLDSFSEETWPKAFVRKMSMSRRRASLTRRGSRRGPAFNGS